MTLVFRNVSLALIAASLSLSAHADKRGDFINAQIKKNRFADSRSPAFKTAKLPDWSLRRSDVVEVY